MKKPLNLSAIKALCFLDQQEEGKQFSVAEMLRKKVGVPRSTLFTIMDWLVEDGLVKQITCRDGRTSYRFSITDAGREVSQLYGRM